MKRLVVLWLLIILGTSACMGGFTTPQVATNPPPAQNTQPPEVGTPIPTLTALPTFTAVVPSPALPLPTATLPAPSQTPVQPDASATPATSPLSMDQLLNAKLTILGADQKPYTLQLQDGKFQQGSDPAQPGYISVTLGQQAAFGDLNGDGSGDAAIILAENFGGSGSFVTLAAVINQNGQPASAGTALIEDRAMVNSIEIKDGEILVDATVHGPNDPMCCPSQPSHRGYRLVGNNLVLDMLTTTSENGVERVIQVDSPANGSEISGAFIIKGGETVSPFENTLTYKIYVSGSNDPVKQATLQVQGDGLGGPGTFELPVEPDKLGLTGVIRIEISDISAANGATLAARSVFVTIQ